MLAAVLLLAPAVARADTLAGRVTDPAGKPVAAASVMIFHGLRLEATLTTDAQGRYGPRRLTAGTYDVLVAAVGFVAEPVAVVITDGNVAIEQDIRVVPLPASEYVVVTAPPLGADALWSVTRNGTVFNRADVLRLQAASLADVLRLVPGLNASATGSGATGLSMWGGATRDVLILVDGVPQTFLGGAIDPADISAVDIERVEVVRGLDTTASGVRAASALVRVSTLAASAPRAELTAEGGTEPNGRIAAVVAGDRAAWKWNASTEWLGTRGQAGRHTASGATVSNDDAERRSASASVLWQDRPAWFLRWQGRAQHTSHGNPGPWGTNPLGVPFEIDALSRTTTRTESTSLSGMTPGPVHATNRFDISFAHWRSSTTQPFVTQDIATRRFQFRYHIDRSFGAAMTVSIGAEREWEFAADSFVRDTAGAPVALHRSFASYYLDGQRSFGTRVFVTGNVRYDLLQRLPLDGNDTAEAYRPALDREVRHLFNGRGAGTVVVHRGGDGSAVIVRFKGGTAVKAPTAEDIGFSENPRLRPERSASLVGGVETTLPGGRATITAEGFAFLFDDLIVPVVVQRDHVRRVAVDNIGRSRARGVTVGASVRLSGHGVASGNLTWLDTRVLNADCRCDVRTSWLALSAGDRLVRRPRLAGSASLVLTAGDHTAFVTAGGRGSMLDLEPTEGQQVFSNSGYLTLSAGVAISLGRPGVHLLARVTNLLDRQYEEVLGYPAPRRAAVIGVRLAAR
jgi:outer membrane cobalamin receptor